MVVASDSHSNMYGGLGCLGTPVVRTDAAALWATGETWWQVPPVAHVKLEGQLQPGVTGKDVIVTLCGHFNEDEVLNHVIEFGGDGVKHFTVDDRLSIANMTTEWGALVRDTTQALEEPKVARHHVRVKIPPPPTTTLALLALALTPRLRFSPLPFLQPVCDVD